MLTLVRQVRFDCHPAATLALAVAALLALGNSSRLAATPAPVQCDYNNNGTCDAADYTIWRDTFGSTTDMRANGDNSNNVINAADYNYWRDRFGNPSGSGGIVGLVCDYNGNGVCDAADYPIWRDTLTMTGSGLAADGDRNNQINDGDFNVWKNGFGSSGAGGIALLSASTSVPEPATWLLAATALIFGCARRPRR